MSRKQLLCCLVALMFVVLRTADAHVHLCFDGKEPPTSMHVADAADHPCETDSAMGHAGDKDVPLSPDGLAKKPLPNSVWLAFAVAFVWQPTPEVRDEPIYGPPQTDAIRPPLYRLPPPRGPPI